MRLLNNEIKMVYEKDNDLDCNHSSFINEDDDDIRVLSMDDENYQTKIREAINTTLNHQ